MALISQALVVKTHPIRMLAVSVVLLAGCQPGAGYQAGTTSATSTQQDELRSASVEWDAVFNSGDTAKLAALYATDAVSMPPGAPTLRGRDALQADFRSFMEANTARHETMVDGIVTDGNLAVEYARYRMTSRPRTGGAEMVETGRHVETRRKIDGRWQIVVEIWNQDAPPPK